MKLLGTLIMVVSYCGLYPANVANAGQAVPSLCGSAVDFAAISNALVTANSNETYESLAHTTLQLTQASQGIRVSSSSHADVLIPKLSVAASVCRNRATDAVLTNATTVPGLDIASFAAVTTFRKTNPWPLTPAPIEQASTAVQFRTIGRYLFVIVSAAPSAQSTFSLSCGAVEYYRVDPQTFDVRPFDGCVEAHKHAPGLPGLGGLPN
jgi:hypothetical protein